MNPTLWQRLQEVVATASSLPAEHRAAYLQEVCADDEDLRGQAEGMLAAYGTSDDLFAKAVGRAASRIAHGSDLAAGKEIGLIRSSA